MMKNDVVDVLVSQDNAKWCCGCAGVSGQCKMTLWMYWSLRTVQNNVVDILEPQDDAKQHCGHLGTVE
jgi:hypothetical protein